MKKVFVLAITIILLSCNNNSDNKYKDQITTDLLGILQNKAEVENIQIKNVSTIENNIQKITFDCTLHFKSDLKKDNGNVAFKKDCTVQETDNVFIYDKTNDILKLVKLEFGKTSAVNGY